MTRVHFLTEGFLQPNVRAVLFPLIVHRRALRRAGIEWRAYGTAAPAALECDVLIVESNFHGKRWTDETEAILEELAGYAGRVERLFYLDTSDSTSLLHPEVLPLVERYYKGQLLRGRRRYLEPHYGRRLYTDDVHRRFGIEDEVPEYSRPIGNEAELAKLGVWWNSALADWSPRGRYCMELYQRLRLPRLLAFPRPGADPLRRRPNPVSCRMGVSYARETVAWQRKRTMARLAAWAPSDRISYHAYVRELRNSRVVVSPFGWGEINYKDYETFLAGAALIKPNMSHIETWPDLYRDDETYLAFRWDAEDLEEVVDGALADPERTGEVATRAQSTYMAHLHGPDAAIAFCRRFAALMSGAGPEMAA